MNRSSTVRYVGLLVLGANLVLALAKGAVWYSTGSLAVGSEAVNSLADSAYSLVVLGGLYLTTQPPDFEHPHGHERIEPFVSLFVALGVFAAGASVMYQSATAVLSGSFGGTTSLLAVGVLVGTAIAKYLLYRYCLRVGEEAHSPAIVATAKDNRIDILTAAAALVGVLGASVGVPILDPVAAGVVAVGILYTGFEIVRDNVGYLVGTAPPEELRTKILERALEHPKVQGAHDVVAHYVGPEVDVSLHVEVEGEMTLREAHAIETDIVQAIRELPEVDDVFVHVDPKELGEWKADPTTDRLAGPLERAEGDGIESDEAYDDRRKREHRDREKGPPRAGSG
ncbi:cation diffusion facilitator family transporter [Halobium salinum]|uniref:Cation diffusion facilitator family transporter n=1 Tax=Halobium salinum TaxID=1364940 RepID=A0ABD5P9K8_9EURY|nr:cation diffusion facilitator family transporter [Halobium salinum]